MASSDLALYPLGWFDKMDLLIKSSRKLNFLD